MCFVLLQEIKYYFFRMSADNRRVKVSSSRIIDYRSLNEQQVEDITLDFFYKPHTLTLLSGLLLALLYTACTRDNSDETLNVYHGVLTIRLVKPVNPYWQISGKFLRLFYWKTHPSKNHWYLFSLFKRAVS